MTNGLTSPRATDRPPGPTPQAARGAPPPSDAFAGMLDAHQARTAIAEGQEAEKPTNGPAPKSKSECRDDQASADTAANAPSEDAVKPEEAVKPEDAEALAATVLASLAPVATAPVEATPVATAPVEAPAAGTAVPAVTAPVVQVDATAVVAEPVVDAAPVVPTAPVNASATATAAAAATTEPVKADAAAPTSDADGAPVAKPVAPAQAPSAGQSQGQSQGQATDDQPKQGNQPGGPAPAPVQQARVAAAYARPVGEQQPQAAPAAPAVTAPSNAPAPASAAAPAPAQLPTATPVPLARSAEAVEHVLRLASSRGVTHARIALHPEELGSVDVHIRSTSEGLVARVVAHSAEAVQTLQHAANDLRKSLEEQGLNVLNLDVSQSGDQSAGRARSDAGELAGGRRDGGEAGSGDGSDDTSTTTTTLRLPSGVLVDVLA